jgi:hypothetical protein
VKTYVASPRQMWGTLGALLNSQGALLEFTHIATPSLDPLAAPERLARAWPEA